MEARTPLPQSAFEEIRHFDLAKAQQIWATGKTIRTYEDPVPPTPDWENETLRAHHVCLAGDTLCAIDKAELDHLIATSPRTPTQFVENTTIDTGESSLYRELRENGILALSLDSSNQDDEDDLSLANIVAERYHVVPYVRPSPLTMRRIEWERRTKLSSPVFRFRIEANEAGEGRVAIIGPKVSQEARVALATRYLKILKARFGDLPSLERIQAWNTAIAKARRSGPANLDRAFPMAPVSFYRSTYTEMDQDPHRNAFVPLDLELHNTAIVTVEPTDEEIAFAQQMGSRPVREQRVITRTRPSARDFLGADPDENVDPTILQQYWDTILPTRGDYLASTVAFGLDMHMANSEWDLGLELESDPWDLPPDAEEDPLSILLD